MCASTAAPGPEGDTQNLRKRLKTAPWRAEATSSAQYLRSTGRVRRADVARRMSGDERGPPPAPSGAAGSSASPGGACACAHSACTQRQRRSKAASWTCAMRSMSSRPARRWFDFDRSSARQLACTSRARSSAAKKAGETAPSRAEDSAGVSWYRRKKVPTRERRASARACSAFRRSVSASSGRADDRVASTEAWMSSQHLARSDTSDSSVPRCESRRALSSCSASVSSSARRDTASLLGFADDAAGAPDADVASTKLDASSAWRDAKSSGESPRV